MVLSFACFIFRLKHKFDVLAPLWVWLWLLWCGISDWWPVAAPQPLNQSWSLHCGAAAERECVSSPYLIARRYKARRDAAFSATTAAAAAACGLELHFAARDHNVTSALSRVNNHHYTEKHGVIAGLQSSAVLFLCRNPAYNFPHTHTRKSTHTHSKENHLHTGNLGKFCENVDVR